MIRTLTWPGAALAAVLVLAAGSRADETRSIDQTLHDQAPQVLQYLRGQKYKNVGVLKFLVALGDGPMRDDVGPINRGLADRLEAALVLGLTKDDEDKLGFVLHASDEVARAGDPDLTHRTPEGRTAFFPEKHALRFQRAWGASEPVPADAFLTGEAVVAPDWRSVRLRVQAFDSSNPKELKQVGDWFTAATDPRTLTECGVSYSRKKGAQDRDDDTVVARVDSLSLTPPPNQAAAAAPPPAQEKQREKDMDDLLNSSPVQLEVLYNKTPVTPHGGAVETPPAGQKVLAFRLTNRDATTTYGVVLKLNGESTIDRQRMDDRYCYKWVLAPGKQITVEGFQTDDQTASGFKVLPPEASKGAEVNYGDNAGVLQMVVFRAAGKEDEPVVANDEKRDQDAKAISRGSLAGPGGRPDSLAALQDQLKAAVNPDKALEGHKGLAVPGDKIFSAAERVPFTPYPAPVTSIVIRYYQPQK